MRHRQVVNARGNPPFTRAILVGNVPIREHPYTSIHRHEVRGVWLKMMLGTIVADVSVVHNGRILIFGEIRRYVRVRYLHSRDQRGDRRQFANLCALYETYLNDPQSFKAFPHACVDDPVFRRTRRSERIEKVAPPLVYAFTCRFSQSIGSSRSVRWTLEEMRRNTSDEQKMHHAPSVKHFSDHRGMRVITPRNQQHPRCVGVSEFDGRINRSLLVDDGT